MLLTKENLMGKRQQRKSFVSRYQKTLHQNLELMQQEMENGDDKQYQMGHNNAHISLERFL